MHINELERYINGLITSYYKGLLKNSVVFFAGITLLFATAGIWIYIYGKKNVYISKEATPLKLHYGYAIFFVALYIHGAYSVLVGWIRVLYLLIAPFTVFALYKLFKFRKLGILCILIMWFPFVERSMTGIYYVMNDYTNIDRYIISGREAVYSLGSFLVVKVFVWYVIMGIITLTMAGYYYRRRFLFKDGAGTVFKGASACPSCGSILVGKAKYCDYCGEDVEQLPKSELNFIILDKKNYCRICRANSKLGLCNKCKDSEKNMEMGK